MRRVMVLVLCLVQLLVLVTGLEAQDADVTRSASARALFDEGVQFTDTGQWAEAADRFGRALALRDSPVIRYNLANALVELGRLVEASELLRHVEKDATAEPAVRSEASQRLEPLSRRVARLTIQAEGDLHGVTVVLDDGEIVPAQLGVAIPVDPREHIVRSVRDGQEVDRQTVSLDEGIAQTVNIRTVRVATPAQAAATVVAFGSSPPVTRDASEPSRKRNRRLWWGIGGGAIAVAAVVVVSVLVAGNSGSSNSKQYQGDFDPTSIPVQVGP